MVGWSGCWEGNTRECDQSLAHARYYSIPISHNIKRQRFFSTFVLLHFAIKSYIINANCILLVNARVSYNLCILLVNARVSVTRALVMPKHSSPGFTTTNTHIPQKLYYTLLVTSVGPRSHGTIKGMAIYDQTTVFVGFLHHTFVRLPFVFFQ